MTVLDSYPIWVQHLAIFNSLVGGSISFILCFLQILIFRSFRHSPNATINQWPNKIVYYLAWVDLFHALEPMLINTRDSGLKIPCYVQYWCGQACHLGTIALASFLALEIFRACSAGTHLTDKYRRVYILLGMVLPMTVATVIMMAGQQWSCEPGSLADCPNLYIDPEASYFGAWITANAQALRTWCFIVPCLVYCLLCTVCMFGSLWRIRRALTSHRKVSATRRLLVLTCTTMVLMVVPWGYRVMQSLTGHSWTPAWVLLYHSVGNGWNGACNVLLSWWRMNLKLNLKLLKAKKRITLQTANHIRT
eukprot:gnl/Dysnectes_brevis/2054_a2371_1136.p1 GENE.gnl/Dysnectes_brevis/2054_a2371_1136~~gnl/Dysnectes_brevis/2054_a2371_1136.p1  ORF type:complete len:307 (+),score=47.96 gnl/Dysnectes_brevis/2054_a2371_1136:60-980(+)